MMSDVALFLVTVCGVGIMYFVGFRAGAKSAMLSVKRIPATIFDSSQRYIEVVDDFIRREVLFELQRWISSNLKVRSMGGSVSFAEKMKDAEAVSKQVATTTAIIFSKMSPDVKNAFYRLYARSSNQGEDDGSYELLNSYIARAVFFYIRRLTMDITIMLDADKDKEFNDILKGYLIEIENEIYKLNDISCISFDTTDTESSS